MSEERGGDKPPLPLIYEVRLPPPPVTREDLSKVMEDVHRWFPDAPDIFNSNGVTKEELQLTMKFIALILHQDIKCFYQGKYSIIFCCANNKTIPKKATIGKKEPSLDEPESIVEDSSRETTENPPGLPFPLRMRTKDDDCGFYLYFHQGKNTGAWKFSKQEKCSLGGGCGYCSSPTICMHQGFLAELIGTYLFPPGISYKKENKDNVRDSLKARYGLQPSARTLERAL